MSWKNEVEIKLTEYLGRKTIVDSYVPIGGGSINETYKISTSEGLFFIKKNSASSFPQMFEKEAIGIKTLGASKEINVPEIIGTGEIDNIAFLILNYIKPGIIMPSFWGDFGKQLSNLHRHTSDKFGLNYDNYIGSLHQINTQHCTWSDFFREERLEYQIKLARDKGEIGKITVAAFERFYKHLDNIFPIEPPALLHGDLWSGNFMVNENGQPVIIDPAVYYGHREMDLGMSQLFGGFDNQFYISYNDHYPLQQGWEERLQYCNLYPLLVHVNLFGRSYLQSVKAILKKF
ncbi:MAG: fructosamine kinase family protein [Bacteroidetes bacterium]|nr:fructosamine kinase family protein [Bacteroidota bacterium]